MTRTIVESGSAAVGDVRNPSVAIPADIMFSPQRAALYSSMATLLVRNPYYIARIVYHVKYHECDALLAIILNSLFGDQAHEPSLIALFNEIIEMEVDRTPSIDTLMRNDAPSLHILSSYFKSQACLSYLQVAVRPTIDVIVQLGNVSLDPDLAAVYQDWARTQRTTRLPLVVSAVEAASYTEVQNLSRRRHRHLVHVATHCLFDIISSRHHIPAGLVAICTSTLQATRRKFTDVDAPKGYSLVGGMFFLRFVNAALTTPNLYGLQDAPPTGTVKSNLKLVARLMQRLSNNSAKLPEEWPPDARKFMRANVEKFHAFVQSLTSGGTGAGRADATGEGADLANRRVQSAGTLAVSTDAAASEAASPRESTETDQHADSTEQRDSTETIEQRDSTETVDPQDCTETDQQRGISNAAAQALSFDESRSSDERTKSSSPEVSVRPGVVNHRIKSTPWTPLRRPHSKARRLHDMVSRPCGGERLQQPIAPLLGSSAATPATDAEATPETADCTPHDQPTPTVAETARFAREASSSSQGSSLSDCSVRSMFDMGQTMSGSGGGGRRPSRTGAFGDVTLPLNDLYLLQKYLLMYEDAWVSGESDVRLHAAGKGAGKSATPMRDCLTSLGPAPALVKASNNHRTRIPLE
ncbi:RasGAP protein [Coemansia sp. RSA 2706]|nr:RasGAP protein [Coemansia sp. RSA 2706]KAJ2329653.1 RasGAP protein [Coemansia sp. RSA 2702]